MCAFFVQIFWQRQNVTRKSCQKRLSYKKSAQKTLMKLTPVQTFTNMIDRDTQRYLLNIFCTLNRTKRISEKNYCKIKRSWTGSINQESLLCEHLFIYVNFDKAFSEVYKRRTFDIELMSNPFKEVCVANTNLPFQFFFW